jgi:lipopolysaccharide assembly protein A
MIYQESLMQIFLIFALIIAALAVIFALQNTVVTTVTFLLWTFNGSLALILLLALITGAFVSLLVSSPALIRDKLTIRNQKKRIIELETSLATHKNQLEEVQHKLNQSEQEQPSPMDTETPKEPNA